jgi:DnaK suppressor protein
MDKRRIEVYRKRLVERQEQLLQSVSKTEQDGRQADGDPTQDSADKAASSYNKEFLFKLSNDDRYILQLVNEALRRVKSGDFGECVACGGEMQIKRLDAVPWARHCIECQEKQEMGILE